jgi:hypothetical protein
MPKHSISIDSLAPASLELCAANYPAARMLTYVSDSPGDHIAAPPAQRCLLYTPPEPACSSTVSSFMNVLLVPLADRDHQVQLGVARKMIDIRLAIRSVMVQCLHDLLI